MCSFTPLWALVHFFFTLSALAALLCGSFPSSLALSDNVNTVPWITQGDITVTLHRSYDLHRRHTRNSKRLPHLDFFIHHPDREWDFANACEWKWQKMTRAIWHITWLDTMRHKLSIIARTCFWVRIFLLFLARFLGFVHFSVRHLQALNNFLDSFLIFLRPKILLRGFIFRSLKRQRALPPDRHLQTSVNSDSFDQLWISFLLHFDVSNIERRFTSRWKNSFGLYTVHRKTINNLISLFLSTSMTEDLQRVESAWNQARVENSRGRFLVSSVYRRHRGQK